MNTMDTTKSEGLLVHAFQTCVASLAGVSVYREHHTYAELKALLTLKGGTFDPAMGTSTFTPLQLFKVYAAGRTHLQQNLHSRGAVSVPAKGKAHYSELSTKDTSGFVAHKKEVADDGTEYVITWTLALDCDYYFSLVIKIDTPAAESAPAPHPVAPEHPITSEERTLESKIGDPQNYKRAQLEMPRDKFAKLFYLNRRWAVANKLLFGGQLVKPKEIYLIRKVGASAVHRLGVWYSDKRKIGISVRLFEGPEQTLLTTLVHEMCHQAQREVDKDWSKTAGGHGDVWMKWMRHVGLTPSRYANIDIVEFMSVQEKQAHEQEKLDKLAIIAERKREEKASGLRRAGIPHAGQVLKWYSTDEHVWNTVLAVCPHRQYKQCWTVLNYTPLPQETGTSAHRVPIEWLYVAPAADAEQFKDPIWDRVLEHALIHWTQKKKARLNKA